jgi:hypothetical protein
MTVKREISCDRCGASGWNTEGRWTSSAIPGWGTLDFEIEGDDPEPGHHRESQVDFAYDLCPDCATAALIALKVFMAEGKDVMTAGVLVEVDLDELP